MKYKISQYSKKYIM